MDENVKYANFLKSKIVKYFNLKNDELDINYIISILNCKSYDLYDSIFLLNESFYEQNKNTKCSSLNNVKKFTQDLVNSKKKFFNSSDVNLDSPDRNFFLSNSNESKTISTSFQDVFENDKKINLTVNTNQNNISSNIKKKEIKKNQNEHLTNDFKQVFFESKRRNNDEKKKKILDDNNKHINKNEYNDEIKNNIYEKDIIKQKNNVIKNHSINDHTMLDLKKTNEQLKFDKEKKNQKNETSEQKSNDNKREDNYFSFFNIKENNYSLKQAIDFIENENNVVKYNNEQNVKEKKKKNLQICICNGQNHKIYANCLFCGKIYCTKIKYKNCIFCENQLYESYIINNLFFTSNQNNNTNNNNMKKLISSVKSSNNFLYKYYFNTNNTYLKKAFELRDKMLRNSINEEQTKVIDDSIDWFEDDIKNEFNNQSIHFSHYDDEIKNEIINKYHEIFGKRFNEINIDIDLVNMKITENKDFLKIKEFNDYLNEKEKEYQAYVELKKQQDINFNNARNYLTTKEKKNLSYINDLKKIFFKENIVKNDTKIYNVEQSYKCDKPTIYKNNKKYKCNVISFVYEEHEDTPN
ncbi:conserved Plasmodium protein, unknown function [Plasmodium sp. gorilla clade G2]|uniref:conserved Plasmodium protein, unknown function n=1 Tax=Plasmodium sp. gorilla clade G2 TaxID=880535 RepID=UPI000D205EEE|nr:conserved Plasmodium protein, unknown function [Plasmodium sp. gorilla clade G2]SOV18014.1 conserved Plasmodium protein, unknown function [Plasmodium sp. gorilla clade G2]